MVLEACFIRATKTCMLDLERSLDEPGACESSRGRAQTQRQSQQSSGIHVGIIFFINSASAGIERAIKALPFAKNDKGVDRSFVATKPPRVVIGTVSFFIPVLSSNLLGIRHPKPGTGLLARQAARTPLSATAEPPLQTQEEQARDGGQQ